MDMRKVAKHYKALLVKEKLADTSALVAVSVRGTSEGTKLFSVALHNARDGSPRVSFGLTMDEAFNELKEKCKQQS